MHPKWLQFSQQQQAENMVEIGTGENHATNRRAARFQTRM